MGVTIKQFEMGDFVFQKWEEIVQELVKDYSINDTGVRVFQSKVESALRRASGMDIKLNVEQKGYLKELYESSEPNDQAKLFMSFRSSSEWNKYRFFIDGEKNHTIHKLTEKIDGNTIEVIPLAHHETLKREIFTSLLHIFGDKAHTKQAISLIDYILNNKELFSRVNVKFVSEPHEKETYTYKLIPRIEASNNYNDLVAWKSFLDRLSDPMAFGAWVWSIYEQKHSGRQCLYLQGPDGEDGKSKVCEVVYKMFGVEYASSLSSLGPLSTKERFGLSGMYGKRLVLVPDLNNSNLLKYSIFRQLTGEDPVTIEYKGQTPFTAQMRVRFWVCSNYPVSVSAFKHEKSRLLWITVDPPKERTTKWKYELIDEYHKFLQFCKYAYYQCCEDHYEIKSDASTEHIQENIGDESSIDVMDQLSFYFDFDPTRLDWNIKRQDFFNTLNVDFKLNRKQIGEYKKILGSYGFSDFNNPKGHRKDGACLYRGIRFKTKGNLKPKPAKIPDDVFDFADDLD